MAARYDLSDYLTDREASHVIAGLLMLQAVGAGPHGHTSTDQLMGAAELATDEGNHELMSKEEIDELIDRIN